ncbi:MAG: PorV/PorQ family protein [Bacteroidota bacterium]|jgi:hypothetical protein|nr:PorV/PorQ family protein [Bacteroidota bacterium]
MATKLFLLLLTIIGTVHNIYGQATAPKYSNEFLSIGVGARALGMSNTQISSVGDVTAGYWNPAGLLSIEDKYQFSLMHAEYFAGIAKYDYAGFATPVDSLSHLGISVIRFAVDDIPDTRFLYDANGAINYNNIRFFSAADYAFLVSYARKIPGLDNLNLGANFKVVHRNVGNFANAWGFGLDIGAQYILKKWNFGLMARDVTGTFNAWSHNSELLFDVYSQTGNEIPENSIEVTLPKAILGVSRSFRIKEKFGILAAVDMDLSFDGKRNVLIKSDLISGDPHLGLELDYLKIVYLRFGVGNIQQVKNFDSTLYSTFQPNFGLGVNIKKVMIDYALTDIGNQSDALYSHVFSLKISLPHQ